MNENIKRATGLVYSNIYNKISDWYKFVLYYDILV